MTIPAWLTPDTPTGSDLIRDGAANITTNANLLLELYTYFQERRWFRGVPATGTDLDDLLEPGMYSIWRAAENRPTTAAGTLMVAPLGTTGGVQQQYISWSNQGNFRTWSRATFSGVFQPWVPDTWIGGPTTRDPDEMLTPGTYWYTATHTNLPITVIGALEVLPMEDTVVQRFTSRGAVPRVFVRRQLSTGAFDPWVEIAAGSGGTPAPASRERTIRGVTVRDTALSILDAHLAQAAIAPVPIVFVGSSTTEGAGASTHEDRYVNLVTRALQDRYGGSSPVQASQTAVFTEETGPGVHGYNAGHGGTTASDYLNTAKRNRIADLAPAAIVHMIGSNDFYQGVDPDSYKNSITFHLNAIDGQVTHPMVHVLVHSYERWGHTPTYEWHEYADALRELEEARANVAFVDVTAAFAAVGVPSTDPMDLILPDRVHANDAGYRVLAQAVLGALVPAVTL